MIQLINTIIENGKSVEKETIEVDTIRIQPTMRAIQNKQGSQTMTSFKIFLSPETVITNAHKVLYQDKKWEILSLYKAQDGNGNVHHIEVVV